MSRAPAPFAPDLPKVGDTLDGKYALVRVLGQGGMGIVFEAEHLRLEQRCAIKLLSPAMLDQPDIVKRFEREARASALLGGRHVTRVMDVETTPEGVPYIVMELLAGRDLDAELQQRGRLPFAEAVDYVLQACAAIHEAHTAGIIHRDLKPGNLFLATAHDECVVKVLDFGISKVSDDDAAKLTGAGTLIGTALYMSPEQLKAAAKVDARSDIWSLGVILYELVTGETPWTGTPPQVAAAIVTEDAPDVATKASLPPPLGSAIHKMLRRDPAERFPTIVDVVEAIVPFATPGSVGRAVGEQIVRRARAPSRRSVVPSDPALRANAQGDAPTVAREVTNVGVTTSAGLPRTSSSTLALLAAAGVVVVAGVVGVVAMLGRGGAREHEKAAASVDQSGVASVTATATATATEAASATASPRTKPGASGASATTGTSASATTASSAAPQTPGGAKASSKASFAGSAGAGAGAAGGGGAAHAKPAPDPPKPPPNASAASGNPIFLP